MLSNLRLLLENGHGDSALISAVQLTVKFTLSARIMDDECLRYQGDTLASIRQRMAIPERAVSESTLAAILLLAGVEVSAFLDFSVCRDYHAYIWKR